MRNRALVCQISSTGFGVTSSAKVYVWTHDDQLVQGDGIHVQSAKDRLDTVVVAEHHPS